MKIEILQGISGAGKSTYADSRKDAMVCSADYFWRGAKMQPHLLPEAHRYCFRGFMGEVLRKNPYVIVDNTNLMAETVSPYYLAGDAYGYEVEIVRFNVSPEVAAERNVHSVPSWKVKQMHETLRHFKPMKNWKIRTHTWDACRICGEANIPGHMKLHERAAVGDEDSRGGSPRP